MTREERYTIDRMIEGEIGKYLDQYFYSKSSIKNHVPFKRISETQKQYAGIDVEFGNLKIDEKAKYKGLLNQILSCPSFETTLINKAGNVQNGWFMQSGSQTNYYLFIAVYTTATKEDDIRFDNIQKLNLLFIKKADVKKYVAQYTNNAEILSWANYLRYNSYDNRHYFKRNKLWLTYSPTLDEQPVNIVMPREEIKKWNGTKELEVTPDKVLKIK